MEHSIGSILLVALGGCVGLYLLWEIKEGIDCLMARRRTKRAYDSCDGSICRWGVDSNGELMRVRVTRLPKE